VAESKRRGKDAIGEDLDDALDDAVDDDALDETDLDEDLDGDLDEEDLDEELEEVPAGARRRRRGRAKEAKPELSKVDGKARTKVDTDQVGIFGRLLRFVREVVAELRKVIWPTRKELLTYTTVLVVFVTVMLTIVATLDAAFAWGILHALGGKK